MNDDQPLIKTDYLDAITEANAAAARESFAVFRRTIRPAMLWGPFVGRLTRELQKFHEAFVAGKRPKLAIMTPPQHGKSSAAEDFMAWEAGKNPSLKTIYASYSDELGVLRNMNLQRLFNSQRYQHIFPNLRIGGIGTGYQCNTSLIEYVGGPGSFRNTTVNGAITGMEQHLGVLDDFVKGRAEANSKVQRDRTWKWFTDDFSPRFSKDSALLVICTRWHVDDLLGRLIEKFPEMRVVSFPAIAEKDERFRREGEALFPSLKPLGMLLDQKKLMSKSSWLAEYQQRPMLVGSGEIPVDKLKVLQHFDRRDISATVLSVDKAGTEGGDGAATAIVIMHRMKNLTFVIENVICGHWGALEREKYIKAWADYMRHSSRTRVFGNGRPPAMAVNISISSASSPSANAAFRTTLHVAHDANSPSAAPSKFLSRIAASMLIIGRGFTATPPLQHAPAPVVEPGHDQLLAGIAAHLPKRRSPAGGGRYRGISGNVAKRSQSRLHRPAGRSWLILPIVRAIREVGTQARLIGPGPVPWRLAPRLEHPLDRFRVLVGHRNRATLAMEELLDGEAEGTHPQAGREGVGGRYRCAAALSRPAVAAAARSARRLRVPKIEICPRMLWQRRIQFWQPARPVSCRRARPPSSWVWSQSMSGCSR